jgi:hypothetical protein
MQCFLITIQPPLVQDTVAKLRCKFCTNPMAIQCIMQLNSSVSRHVTLFGLLKVDQCFRRTWVDFQQATQELYPITAVRISIPTLRSCCIVCLIEHVLLTGLVFVDQEVGLLILLTSPLFCVHVCLKGIVYQDNRMFQQH